MFSENPARTYTSDAQLTHTLGYLRTVTENEMKKRAHKNYRLGDISGFSGLERVYEDSLRGMDGVEFRLVDIFGVDHGKHPDTRAYPPSPGSPLITTIDESLQVFAESKMDTLVGSIVCMNPKTGEILSFVSAPNYDLSPFVGPIPYDVWNGWNNDPRKPLMNRGVQGAYPPASPFKLIASALALEKNLIDPYKKVSCSGAYTLGGRAFHCWNIYGHGDLNMQDAIKHSCNIYFYKLIQQMKFKDWSEFVELFGFGQQTGVDLPNEKSGLVPNKSYMNKKYGKYGWATGNLLSFVIGQGDVLATPIQVANMMNLIATKGNTFQPHFNLNIEPHPVQLTLKNKTWKFLQNATWQVVNGEQGTGKSAKIENGVVRGKTGTGQNPHGEDHSWFTGYVTTDNGNQMSISIIIENGGKGSGIATQISQELFSFFANQQLGTHD
jgi:penicillin-binding protein 2